MLHNREFKFALNFKGFLKSNYNGISRFGDNILWNADFIVLKLSLHIPRSCGELSIQILQLLHGPIQFTAHAFIWKTTATSEHIEPCIYIVIPVHPTSV